MCAFVILWCNIRINIQYKAFHNVKLTLEDLGISIHYIRSPSPYKYTLTYKKSLTPWSCNCTTQKPIRPRPNRFAHSFARRVGADIDEQKTATSGRNYTTVTSLIQSYFGLLKAFYIMIYLQKALTYKHVARVFRVICQPLSQCLLGFRATLEALV
jgi:hypothetical protein